MLIARQRSAQGLWSVTDQHNPPQGSDAEQRWETEAKVKHIKQICDAVRVPDY